MLYVEALGNEALNRRRIETGHALVAAVEQHTIDRHGAPPAGEQIGRIGAAVLVGGTSELVLAWLDGRIDVSREQLVDDATALFLAVGEAAAAAAGRSAAGPARADRRRRRPGASRPRRSSTGSKVAVPPSMSSISDGRTPNTASASR